MPFTFCTLIIRTVSLLNMVFDTEKGTTLQQFCYISHVPSEISKLNISCTGIMSPVSKNSSFRQMLIFSICRKFGLHSCSLLLFFPHIQILRQKHLWMHFRYMMRQMYYIAIWTRLFLFLH